jgi:RNA polymerase sigma-70 factor (ECF subfamily)
MAGWWGTVPDGRGLLTHILRSDNADGVRERILDITASTQFTVMECELISPSWDPTHCPPSVLWLMRLRGERIDGIRLFHPVQA